MLGYLAAGFIWGAIKAQAVGARRAHDLGTTLIVAPIVEELQFRLGVERLGLARGLILSSERARLVSSALFGLMHPGLEVDAAVGGYVYSKAFDAHGLAGAVFSHLAHNLGVALGSRG